MEGWHSRQLEAETTKGWYFTGLLPGLHSATFPIQHKTPCTVILPVYHELGLPILVSNQTIPYRHPQANLIEAIAELRLFPPRYTRLTTRLRQQLMNSNISHPWKSLYTNVHNRSIHSPGKYQQLPPNWWICQIWNTDVHNIFFDKNMKLW